MRRHDESTSQYTHYVLLPDEDDDEEGEDVITAGQLHADLMDGFAQMEAFRTGKTPVRITHLVEDEYRTYWTFADGPAADRYEVVIGRSADPAGFKAHVPQLDGCAATGATQMEALANVRAAIDAWIDAAVTEERDIPVPSTLAIAA